MAQSSASGAATRDSDREGHEKESYQNSQGSWHQGCQTRITLIKEGVVECFRYENQEEMVESIHETGP